MKLMYLEIANFRGIQKAKLAFPVASRIACIIGPGDSCKSTILKAIEWVLWPTWNLNPTDNDFYRGDPTAPITIAASITELPSALLKEDKFGLYLRDLDAIIRCRKNDEPTDDGTIVLTIRLKIDSTLEPKWEVITSRSEAKEISYRDRKLMALGVVGIETEKDFQWGRGSVLRRNTESKEIIQNAYTEALRSAVTTTSLESLDDAVSELQTIGERYGVAFTGKLHNQLLMQSSSFGTNAALFDQDVPVSQRGLGSKRLLSIGMNISTYSDGAIVLVDEVETGLEPYRLLRLINAFRDVVSEKGQVIMTTHSTNAICECTVHELVVCRNSSGSVVFHYFNSDTGLGKNVQRLIRKEPGALLSKRVIVCEGKTEIGFVRAFDRHVLTNAGGSLAYFGVSTALGEGDGNLFEFASFLKERGYDVSILMDADVSFSKTKKKASSADIPVFSWGVGNAIEEQLFVDSPLAVAQALIDYVVLEKSLNYVKDKLDKGFPDDKKPFYSDNNQIILSNDISIQELRMIGSIAKDNDNSWFKRIDHGEYIGNIVFEKYEDFPKDCMLKTTMNELKKWVVKE